MQHATKESLPVQTWTQLEAQGKKQMSTLFMKMLFSSMLGSDMFDPQVASLVFDYIDAHHHNDVNKHDGHFIDSFSTADLIHKHVHRKRERERENGLS